MKAYALDLRKRVVKFIQSGGSNAEAARRFALGRSTVYRYRDAAQTKTLAPKNKLGALAQTRPTQTPSSRQKTSRRHPQRTSNRVWRQPSGDLGAAGATGLLAKKNSSTIASATRRRGGSFAANWKRWPASPSSISTNAAWITAWIVSMVVLLGAKGVIRPSRANSGNAPASAPLPVRTNWWHHWYFKAVATRRW